MFNFWKSSQTSTTPESHRETVRSLREKQLQKWEEEMAKAPTPPKAEDSDEYRPRYKNSFPSLKSTTPGPTRVITMSSLNRGKSSRGG